ncbi:MAG: inosine/xanthosine triphosphatase [Candidatus Paceibacterota bacterium]
MHIVVASKNPVKIDAAKRGFERVFSDVEVVVEGVKVGSEVSDQPVTDKESREGAISRVRNARQAEQNADYWVGIESGVEKLGKQYGDFTWVAIGNRESKIGTARSACFILPMQANEYLERGEELSVVGDVLFKGTASGSEHGMIGKLTGGVIDRTDYTVEAVVLALIPFINAELYTEE